MDRRLGRAGLAVSLAFLILVAWCLGRGASGVSLDPWWIG